MLSYPKHLHNSRTICLAVRYMQRLTLFSCPSERLAYWRYIVCVSCWPSDSTSIESRRTAGPMCTQSPKPPHIHKQTHTYTHLHTARVLLIKQAAVYVFTGRVWSADLIVSTHFSKCLIWYRTCGVTVKREQLVSWVVQLADAAGVIARTTML